MSEKGYRQFIGKIFFRGTLLIKTGLHIGGNQDSMQIGGVDSPVIKDSSNNLPYIPGSSLKGKLRSILEKFGKRRVNDKEEAVAHNRNIGTRWNPLFIHCCEDIRYALTCDVCRIFGSSGDDRSLQDRLQDRKQKAENLPARLFVRDCLLPIDSLTVNSQFTEVKTETGIDRTNMAANPRKVERVLPNTRFSFELVYNVEALALQQGKPPVYPAGEVTKDLGNILTCMELLQAEGLGGYSSRGYGKVEFLFTEFCGRSLDFYQGKEEKTRGRISTAEAGTPEPCYFTIRDARESIPEIVEFLKKEFNVPG